MLFHYWSAYMQQRLEKMDGGLFGKADPYIKLFAITSLTSGPDGEHGWLVADWCYSLSHTVSVSLIGTGA